MSKDEVKFLKDELERYETAQKNATNSDEANVYALKVAETQDRLKAIGASAKAPAKAATRRPRKTATTRTRKAKE